MPVLRADHDQAFPGGLDQRRNEVTQRVSDRRAQPGGFRVVVVVLADDGQTGVTGEDPQFAHCELVVVSDEGGLRFVDLLDRGQRTGAAQQAVALRPVGDVGHLDVEQTRLGHQPLDVLHEGLQRVGVVLQDPFISASTVRENITLGLPISQSEVEAAAKHAQLHDYIMSLPEGYETRLGERGGELSTGQRQLLSLARTLARRPRILILDEATANVDSHTEAVITQALNKLRGSTTIIAIAHRLSTITHADQIVVLHQGRIMQQGSHLALLADAGLYRHMYELQMQKSLVQEAVVYPHPQA